MSEQRNLVSLGLAGQVTPDGIGKWDENSSGLGLHEYLGLAPKDYGIWLGDPDQLQVIIANRKASPVSHL